MSQKRPQTGERYLHFKNKLYQVLTIAIHSETGEELVIYQALYGDYRVYARPLSMFTSEVDHEKYPDVVQKYRFELVSGDGAVETSPKPEREVPKQPQPKQQASAEPKKMPEEKPRQEWKAPYVTERKAAEQPRSQRRAQFARQPQSAIVRKTPNSPAENGQLTSEELMMAFFDARTYSIKRQILDQMEGRITDMMINNMAVAMDVVIPEGPLEKRYQELKRCVRTYERYETNRMK